ncbi:hypothetical protein P692DRAFT_20891429 [Suillus brevipes Sb2]|nr:hypothetical protein P692DRAFT_20891429 [Suillus brevipes Sb2]
MVKECAHSCFIRISIGTSMTTGLNTALLFFATRTHRNRIGNEYPTAPTTKTFFGSRVRKFQTTLIQSRAFSCCLMLCAVLTLPDHGL